MKTKFGISATIYFAVIVIIVKYIDTHTEKPKKMWFPCNIKLVNPSKSMF